MTFITQKYKRRPFDVEAIQITEENLEELAVWCDGKILQTDIRGNGLEKYIFARVHTPMHERQKMGFVGEWLLKTDKGFKIYTEQAFNKLFEPAEDNRKAANEPSPEDFDANQMALFEKEAAERVSES